MSENSRSTPVLDDRGKLGGDAGDRPSLTGSEGTPPPPPPPPAADGSNLDWRAQREAQRAQNRRLKHQRNAEWIAKARGLHRGYYIAGGVIVAGTLGFLGARSIVGMQQDANLALAHIAAGAQPVATTAAPAPVTVQGMPNPLESLPLSTQARWTIGSRFMENDAGDAVGFSPLPLIRSSVVLTDLIERVDLCTIYVGLSDKAEVVLVGEPTAGFDPLLDPAQCPAAGAPMSVPSDPVPPTTAATVPAS